MPFPIIRIFNAFTHHLLILLSVLSLFFSLANADASDDTGDHTQETIGQAASPKEDISHLFLRDSEVLLNPNDIQLSIGFDYNTNESQRSFRKNRSRSVSIPLSVSYGVTEKLEVNASVPLLYNQNELIAPTNVAKDNQSGVGDLSLGASYQLKAEAETSPSLTASLGVTTPTGKTSNAIGSGFWGVSTGLSVSKSIDPAVVFFSMGYQHTFDEKQNGVVIQPGDSFQYGFGAGLSVNSAVAFSGRISGSYQNENKESNQTITGSSAESIAFIGGMSYRINRKARLETTLDLGLSEDSGDVGIGVTYIWNL
jgi:long-subunit fatty acid transport protein